MMQLNTFLLLVIMGAAFSLIAAIMAFLISYTEYEKHFIDNKGKAMLMSLEAAAVIFALFMVVTVVAAFFFGGASVNHSP